MDMEKEHCLKVGKDERSVWILNKEHGLKVGKEKLYGYGRRIQSEGGKRRTVWIWKKNTV